MGDCNCGGPATFCFCTLGGGSAGRRRPRVRRVCRVTGDEVVDQAIASLRPDFEKVDALVQKNLRRVLDAFQEHRVGSQHFAGNTGYGHGDEGRDVIDRVYASIFGCESALVRVQFFSGTHAIAAALFAALRPGDEMLSAVGEPYDTLEEVIGSRGDAPGSLAYYGISYREHPLLPDGTADIAGLIEAISPTTKLVLIQRSCGYSWRPSLSVATISEIIAAIKEVNPNIVCFVDNCFGELTEVREPTHVGADLVAGSLIKNCGGTLAPTGGYVAGRRDLVQAAANRLSAPGVAGGPSLGFNKQFLQSSANDCPARVEPLGEQGLFLAPQIVGESLKGVKLVSRVMSELGYSVNPKPEDTRTDIIQAIRLGSRERVLEFWITPGYGDEVVFADGNFVDGSTLELSADGPLREPYVVFAQGGTHWTHWSLVLRQIVDEIGPYNQ